MIINNSQCFNCRHFDPDQVSCTAFDDIPREILGNVFPGEDIELHDHRQPYPGDNGIRFEPLPGRRHPLEVINEKEFE
jgi:hypothetical protein